MRITTRVGRGAAGLRIGAAVILLAAARGSGAWAGEAPDYDAVAGRVRALLEELVSADTTNPPGNEARAVAIVRKRLEAAGIGATVSEFAPGRENLLARLGGDGSAKPLLLLAHTDVVGADGQSWSSDPHRVTESAGFLVGRGVSDDLGMVALAVETMIAVKRSGIPLRRDLVLALTGDEESGGGGIRALLGADPGALAAGIALNEGGGIRLDEGGRVSFVSLQVAEKTYRDFRLTARGTTGHSSVPRPDNAIARLGRAVERVGGYRFPVRLLPVTRAYFAARAALEHGERAAAMQAAAAAKGAPPASALRVLEADPILTATLRTTCVPTLVRGGTRENALPADATANVNCRILPDETVAQVQAALGKVIDDPAIEIEPVLDFGSGPPSPVEGEGPAAIARAVGALFPGTPIIPYMSLGATDSRFLRQGNVAAYGFNPIALSDADALRAHGVDERISAASLRPAGELLHRLIVDLAAANGGAPEGD